jgi:hypothetical protein
MSLGARLALVGIVGSYLVALFGIARAAAVVLVSGAVLLVIGIG